MKIVLVGASAIAVACAKLLIRRRHEVVIIEREEARIAALSEELDCGFLQGDGTYPHVLEELQPETVDLLIATTGSDQDNILACLVAKTLKVKRVVPLLKSVEFERVALALGLTETLLPVQTIGRYLADTAEGRDLLKLANLLRGDAFLFSVVVPASWQGPVGQLKLPRGAAPVWLYRRDQLSFLEPDLELKEGDELVILARDSSIAEEITRQLEQGARLLGGERSAKAEREAPG